MYEIIIRNLTETTGEVIMLVSFVIPNLVLLLNRVSWKEFLRMWTGLKSGLGAGMGLYGFSSHDEPISEHVSNYRLVKLCICRGRVFVSLWSCLMSFHSWCFVGISVSIGFDPFGNSYCNVYALCCEGKVYGFLLLDGWKLKDSITLCFSFWRKS